MTSWRQDKELACILDVGEHICVRHRSCDNNEGAKTPSIKDLQTLKDTGMLEVLSPLTATVLQKIRDAVPNSRMKLGHARILEEQGLVEE